MSYVLFADYTGFELRFFSDTKKKKRVYMFVKFKTEMTDWTLHQYQDHLLIIYFPLDSWKYVSNKEDSKKMWTKKTFMLKIKKRQLKFLEHIMKKAASKI